MRVQDAGRDVIKWGSGADEAADITANMTKARANEIVGELGRGDVEKIRDWYLGVADDIRSLDPSKLEATPTPLKRAELMQRILDMAE